MDDPATRVKDEVCEVKISRTPSPASPAKSHPSTPLGEQKTKLHLNSKKAKSRVKTSSRRLFLDDSLSDEEKLNGGVANIFVNKNSSDRESEGTGNGGKCCSDSSATPLSITSENSWTCPLNFDDISPSPSDPEIRESPSLLPQTSGLSKAAVRPNSSSSVILRLRRMFKGLNRKKARYQAVSDSKMFADPSLSQIDDRKGEVCGEKDQRTPKLRWRRAQRISHTLEPLSSPSKRKNRSLGKVKHCPHPPAFHGGKHRRHWALQSAAHRAQKALKFYYPDLVGKRILHLYEEDDKSEVWYRGEVLCVHEAHSSPLKTTFEVRYDSEPEWRYYLELLIDYKKGWLKIED